MTAALAALAGLLAAAGALELAGSSKPASLRRRSADSPAPAAAGVSRLLVVLLARAGRHAAPRAPDALAARLDAADSAMTPGELMAVKAGAGIAAAAASPALASLLPGRLDWLLLVGAPVLGFLAPDLRLRRLASRRTRRCERELADVAELLRVCVQAGLSPRRSLAEVGRRHPGLLARELRRTAARMEMGESHVRATDRLARRCPAPGVVALVAILRRAERHGAPLAAALGALAEQARADAARATMERAARAAPKIQLVVALLLVPSAMLLIAAAMLPALSWG